MSSGAVNGLRGCRRGSWGRAPLWRPGGTLAFVSRAPQTHIERVKARMGWEMPWYTLTDGFDADFGVDEWHGTNAFIREIGRAHV